MILASLTSHLFIFSRRNHTNKANDEEEENFTKQNNLLCRFVFDGTGVKVGETVSLAGDIIIIKNGKKYLGVPLKHIDEEGKTLMVKGLVDFSKAEELGEEWRKKSFRDFNQDVNHDGKNNIV
ncbi:MAG: hypothetical protein NT038_04970 [Euryarchaeota archaeon]|nr:hypothetical protein [Euryarchaeota archaeon]